jgi:iron complex outermembrane recepter protein
MPAVSHPAFILCIATLACTGLHAEVEQKQNTAETPDAIDPAVLPEVVGQAQLGLIVPPSSVQTDTRRPVDLAIDPVRALAAVPGLYIADRRNEAQDVRLVVRGFGARSAFGLRGIRVVVDGIPASMPDGQSQLSHIPWQADAVLRVERGPLAALAGNGGALIEVTTLPRLQPRARVETVLAASDRQRLSLDYNGLDAGCVDCAIGINALTYHNGGFRPQSGANRQQLGGRWQRSSDGGSWDLRLHALRSRADDPLGLDRATLARDPDSTATAALAFDTRKRLDHAEAALGWRASDQRLAVSFYLGQRDVEQFLAVPAIVQRPPTHPGGVIDLARVFGGLHLSGGDDPEAVAAGWRWRIGLEDQHERRRGFENFVGDQLGVRGVLRRNESNRGWSADAVWEGWVGGEDWLLRGGVRATQLRSSSDDRFITPGNPDDSGSSRDRALLPVLGYSRQLTPALQWHAAIGKGFEPPTLAERAYGPGDAGFNADLRATRHRQAETGLRWQPPESAWQIDASLFALRSTDELVAIDSVGGRTIFGNVADSRRRGIELAASGSHPQWQWRAALSWLDATIAQDGIDQPLPGVPRRWLGLQLTRLLTSDRSVGIDVVASDRVPVTIDSNEAAAGYGRVDLWWQQRGLFGQRQLSLGLRLDNVFDSRHAGSVIVSERNGRYYEPAAGREWALALGWDW